MLFFTIFVYASNPSENIMKIVYSTHEKYKHDKYKEFLDDAFHLFRPKIEKDALNLIAEKMKNQMRMNLDDGVFMSILAKKIEKEFYTPYFFHKYSFNHNFVAKNLYEVGISKRFVYRIIEFFDTLFEKLRESALEIQHIISMQKTKKVKKYLLQIQANIHKFQNETEISLLIFKLYQYKLLGYYRNKLHLYTRGDMNNNEMKDEENKYNGIPCLIRDKDGILYIGNKSQKNIYKIQAINLENIEEKKKEYISMVQKNVENQNHSLSNDQNMRSTELRVLSSSEKAPEEIITGTKDDWETINDDKKQDLLFLLQLDLVDENMNIETQTKTNFNCIPCKNQ